MPAGWKLKEFDNTVKMSSYLIAIVIANYSYVEASASIFPKPVRVNVKKILSFPFDSQLYDVIIFCRFMDHLI